MILIQYLWVILWQLTVDNIQCDCCCIQSQWVVLSYFTRLFDLCTCAGNSRSYTFSHYGWGHPLFFLRFSLRVSIVRARSFLRVFSCAHLFPCACMLHRLSPFSVVRPTQIFGIFKTKRKKSNNNVVKPFFTWNIFFLIWKMSIVTSQRTKGTKTWKMFTVYCVCC